MSWGRRFEGGLFAEILGVFWRSGCQFGIPQVATSAAMVWSVHRGFLSQLRKMRIDTPIFWNLRGAGTLGKDGC